MEKLTQALALLNEPVTLDTMIQWEALCQSARGDEALQIGELYTSLLSMMNDDVYEQYMATVGSDTQ